MRLRQYYPGQEVINEQSDPNLAETPHYKEKQTILPNPITIDQITGEKKLSTPVKRSHDGRPKKPSKFPDSPINNDHHSDRVLLADKKSDEAKIDMRKLIVEPKHRKRSTSSSGHKIHSSTTTTTSSSTSHSCSKEKHRSSSDHHRSSSNKSSKHRDEHRKSSSNHSSSSSKNSKHKNASDVRQSQEHQLTTTTTTNNQSIVSVPAESIIIEHPMEFNAVNDVPTNYNDHLKAIICPPEPSTEQIIEIETVTSPPQLMDPMSMDTIIEVSSTVEPELVESIVTDETSVVACNEVCQTQPEFQSTMTLTPTQPLTSVTPKIKKNILKTSSSSSMTRPQPDLLSSILAGMDNTPNRNSSSSGPSSF